MRNVLILGANGFIGRYLVKRLDSEFNVFGYGMHYYPSECKKFIQGDFCNEISFKRIIKENNFDTIFHLISTTKPNSEGINCEKEVIENVIPTIRLLEAMRETNCKKILFVSSGGTVYGELNKEKNKSTDKLFPKCNYGLQKMIIEDVLMYYSRVHGIDCKIARLSNPYGYSIEKKRTQGVIPIFIRKLFDNESITLYGDTFRDYIHINDAIDAIVSLSYYTGKSRIFNIGTGIPVRLSDLVKEIEIVADKKFKDIKFLPIRSFDVQANVLDISETIKELNWFPKVSLKEGIESVITEIRKDIRDNYE